MYNLITRKINNNNKQKKKRPYMSKDKVAPKTKIMEKLSFVHSMRPNYACMHETMCENCPVHSSQSMTFPLDTNFHLFSLFCVVHIFAKSQNVCVKTNFNLTKN